MPNDDIYEGLRKRFEDVFPLLFHRSRERAKSPGDLFDILASLPERFPVVWNGPGRCWAHTDDLFQTGARDEAAKQE